MVGFFEIMTYMLVLSRVIGGGRSLTTAELLFYCAGFSAGNFVGSFLESKFMNSYHHVEVIVNDDDRGKEIIEKIRSFGVGATVLHAEGRSGPRLLVEVFCRSKDMQHISSIIGEDGFVTVSDVKTRHGGWFHGTKK